MAHRQAEFSGFRFDFIDRRYPAEESHRVFNCLVVLDGAAKSSTSMADHGLPSLRSRSSSMRTKCASPSLGCAGRSMKRTPRDRVRRAGPKFVFDCRVEPPRNSRFCERVPCQGEALYEVFPKNWFPRRVTRILLIVPWHIPDASRRDLWSSPNGKNDKSV